MHMHMHACAYACICMHVHACACICMHMHACICIWQFAKIPTTFGPCARFFLVHKVRRALSAQGPPARPSAQGPVHKVSGQDVHKVQGGLQGQLCAQGQVGHVGPPSHPQAEFSEMEACQKRRARTRSAQGQNCDLEPIWAPEPFWPRRLPWGD